MPVVDVQITSPPDDSTFIRGQRIEIQGSATWSGDSQSPVERILLAAYESQFIGDSFTPWIHVNDFFPQFANDPNEDHKVLWSHVVMPFDGLARYMLTAYAYDANRTVIGSSRPLFLESSN